MKLEGGVAFQDFSGAHRAEALKLRAGILN